MAHPNENKVDFMSTLYRFPVEVAALTDRYSVADNKAMKRDSVYPYEITDAPGANIHRLRVEKDWSLRELSSRCNPPLDHSTVARLEKNRGATMDTIERVAAALGVQPSDLWLPPEIFEYSRLPDEKKKKVADYVHDVYSAYKYQKAQVG